MLFYFTVTSATTLTRCTYKNTAHALYYAICETQIKNNLLPNLPLLFLLNSTEHFEYFSWLKLFLEGKKKKKKKISSHHLFAFWVDVLSGTGLRARWHCEWRRSSGSGPPVWFTKIHLKGSNFHAWYENSFLTLITSPLCKDQMFSAEINFPTGGRLSKEVRCTFLSNGHWVRVKIYSELIASIICQIFIWISP